MAASVIGALRVNLGLDTAAFQEGLKKSRSGLAKFGALAKTGALAVAAAAAAGGVALAASMRTTINAADDMSKAAQKIGIPTEELSRLKYAADLSGVSFEGLQTAVGKLSKNMADARVGVGEGAAAFEALGISVTDSEGNLRASSDVMKDISERFAAMPDGAEKTALAMDLMGRSGKDMIPMLNGGAEALGSLMAEADTFGQVISTEMGKNAEAFNDNLTRLGGAFGAISADLSERLLPYLVQFTDWLVENGPAVAEVVAQMIEFAINVVKAGAAVVGFVRDAGDGIAQFASDVTATFQALPDQFLQIGRDIIDGIWRGIEEKIAWIKEKIKGFSDMLPEWVRERLGISSPSKVFAEIGGYVMEGLSQGLTAGMKDVTGELGGFADEIANTFAGVLTGATDFRDAMSGLLRQIGGQLLQSGITGFLGGLKIPGFANGTNFAPGGLALVGERGPELVNLPRGSRVTPNGDFGGGMARVEVTLSPDLQARIVEQAQGQSVRIVQGHLAQYDRGLPDRLAGIGRDPWKRG